MGIQINMLKNDVSYLFAGLGKGTADAASSNFLGQYASIKNGSYGKLMKAYYSQNSNDSIKKLTQNAANNAMTSEDAKALTKVQGTTDSLKESADALLDKGKKSVFTQKDVTSKDENGIETTKKEYDVDAIYSAVNQFVKDYNSVIDAAGKVEDKSIQRSATGMVNTSIQNGRLLGKVGITLSEDGKLSLDKDSFTKADMSTVKSLFQGSGSYGYQVSAQASMINFAADHAVSKANTYTVGGTYNNAFNTGNIFNSYF